MKKYFLPLAIILMGLSSCKAKQPDNQTIPTIATDSYTYSSETETEIIPLYSINPLKESKEIKSGNGSVLISIDISVPSISPSNDISDEINDYYKKMLKNNMTNAELELQDCADAYLRYNSELTTPYYFNQNYTLCLNNQNYISLKRINEVYSGGVHENYTIYSDSFNMKNGGKLSLSDIFDVDEDVYMERLLQFVKNQIEENKGNYYEEYQDMISSFDTQNFYLTQTHLVLFYQHYDLAAYSAGIPEFSIPYEDISDIMNKEVKNGLKID